MAKIGDFEIGEIPQGKELIDLSDPTQRMRIENNNRKNKLKNSILTFALVFIILGFIVGIVLYLTEGGMSFMPIAAIITFGISLITGVYRYLSKPLKEADKYMAAMAPFGAKVIRVGDLKGGDDYIWGRRGKYSFFVLPTQRAFTQRVGKNSVNYYFNDALITKEGRNISDAAKSIAITNEEQIGFKINGLFEARYGSQPRMDEGGYVKQADLSGVQIGKIKSEMDVQTGDPDFDSAFLVMEKEAGLARSILEPEIIGMMKSKLVRKKVMGMRNDTYVTIELSNIGVGRFVEYSAGSRLNPEEMAKHVEFAIAVTEKADKSQ